MSSNEQVSAEQESHFSSPLRRSRIQKQSSPSLLLVVTCFVAFWALLATPVVQVRIAPLFDFPNHLARMYVISEVDNNPLLYRFYSIHWAMIPNLAMDVIVPPIAKVIGLFQAGRLFMLLLIALLLSGVHAVPSGSLVAGRRALWSRPSSSTTKPWYTGS